MNKLQYKIFISTNPVRVDGVASHPPLAYSFSQNNFHIQFQEDTISQYSWGHAPDTPSKSMLHKYAPHSMQARPTLCQPLTLNYSAGNAHDI